MMWKKRPGSSCPYGVGAGAAIAVAGKASSARAQRSWRMDARTLLSLFNLVVQFGSHTHAGQDGVGVAQAGCRAHGLGQSGRATHRRLAVEEEEQAAGRRELDRAPSFADRRAA